MKVGKEEQRKEEANTAKGEVFILSLNVGVKRSSWLVAFRAVPMKRLPLVVCNFVPSDNIKVDDGMPIVAGRFSFVIRLEPERTAFGKETYDCATGRLDDCQRKYFIDHFDTIECNDHHITSNKTS